MSWVQEHPLFRVWAALALFAVIGLWQQQRQVDHFEHEMRTASCNMAQAIINGVVISQPNLFGGSRGDKQAALEAIAANVEHESGTLDCHFRLLSP